MIARLFSVYCNALESRRPRPVSPFARVRARARHRQAERVHEESLGSYATAQQAAEDLADGHTFSLPGGIDASDLGIPNDLAGWEKIPPEA